MLIVYAGACEREEARNVAYALLERAHALLCGGPVPELARTGQGKPYFPDGRFEFSLTHTRTIAALAVSDRPVGVDAETFRPVRQGVAQRSMGPEELAWIAAQPEENEALLTLWTCKEALVKRSGQGLQFRPRAVRLSFDRGAPQGFQVRRLWDGVVTVCPSEDEPAVWRMV